MQIANELAAAAEELISIAKPKKGQIFVLGCSTDFPIVITHYF